MKIKNIIGVAIMAIGLFAACSEEEKLEPVQKAGAVTIQFGLNMDVTKADGNFAPEPEELIIQNYAIAVFKGESLVDNAPCERIVSGSTLTGAVGAYTTTLEDLPANVPLSFLVIANSQNASPAIPTSSTGLIYADFKNMVETTSSFTADKLVKVGKTENVTLPVSVSKITIPVSLIQLAARIDFEGVVVEGNTADKKETTDSGWKQLGEQDVTTLYKSYFSGDTEKRKELNNLVESSSVSNTGGAYANNGFKNNGPDGYLYLNWDSGKKRYNNRLTIYKRTETTKTVSTSDFAITQKAVNAVNHQSDVLIYDVIKIENQRQSFSAGSINEKNTFYTYESFGGNLQLSLQGGVSSSERLTTITTYKIKVYSYSKSSWKEEGTNKELILTKLQKETSDEKIVSPVVTGKYDLSIPFSSIIKGNRYTIKGVYRPTAIPVIEWKVDNWSDKEVDIPSFE